MNNWLVAQTTSCSKSSSYYDWYQSFLFQDLPELSSLRVDIYRVKKANRTFVGSAFISLEGATNGELVEGRYPIVRQRLDQSKILIVGEVKLRYKLDE